LSEPYFRIAVFVIEVGQPFDAVFCSGEIREFLEHSLLSRASWWRRRSCSVTNAHLHVELVELGESVGAAILVAETGRDLEISIEAADHQELLELLRRLRQRVKFSGVQA
jgi:hypothetical protein